MGVYLNHCFVRRNSYTETQVKYAVFSMPGVFVRVIQVVNGKVQAACLQRIGLREPVDCK